MLSDEAEISVLTCSPGNEAYSVYGHSAIRVVDDLYNYDIVFNYGIFDFSAPNFIYRFAVRYIPCVVSIRIYSFKLY